jgi:hypothetical protein
MTLDGQKGDRCFATATARQMVRQVEADLMDQGIALFPSTAAGRRAQALWYKIKPHLLRGGSVDITPSTLDLDWHRQELKRARDVLVTMGLIRRRRDDFYVLGRYDPIDDSVRDRFLELKLLERLMVGLSALTSKSKTRKEGWRS